jgi:hypothetical protein
LAVSTWVTTTEKKKKVQAMIERKTREQVETEIFWRSARIDFGKDEQGNKRDSLTAWAEMEGIVETGTDPSQRKLMRRVYGYLQSLSDADLATLLSNILRNCFRFPHRQDVSNTVWKGGGGCYYDLEADNFVVET